MKLRRKSSILFSLLGASGVSAAGVWYRFFKRPLPKVNGSVRVKGLDAEVEILRDRYGVPHISAGSVSDMIFGQGFCHAQDRLWQLFFYKRVASGTVSEFAGAETVPIDRLMRTLGLYRVAKNELSEISDELHTHLEAYAAGLNAAVESSRSRPAELQILGTDFEPWSPIDSLAIIKILALGLCTNWEHELIRAQMAREIGTDKLTRIEPQYPRRNPIVMKPGEAYGGNGIELAEQVGAVREAIGLSREPAGSNNWVVSGDRSETGLPLLANDPHMACSMPNMLYHNHLCGGEIDVQGASLPSQPGVFMGQNERVAWGFTNVLADVQDLFVERIRPIHNEVGKHEYEFENRLLEADTRIEEIEVKGRSEPEKLEVICTHHGPIINHTVDAVNEPPLALSWTALQYPCAADVMIDGPKSKSGSDIVEAFRDWNVPPLNMVWADIDGNIGYQMIGKLPIRKGGAPDVPKPGWSGDYEWEGMVPYDELPSVTNPESGFLVTTNNRVVSDDYPYHITSEWQDGYRAKRIEQLLQETEKHSLETFSKIQLDIYSIPGIEVAHRLARIDPPCQREARALERVRNWDGNLTPDTIAGTIVHAFLTQLTTLFAETLLGDQELVDRYLSKSSTGFMPITTSLWRTQERVLQLWEENDTEWFDDRSWEDVAMEALSRGLDDLERRFGKNANRWKWGKAHEIEFSHPLGDANPAFAKILSRKLPGFGAQETVLQTGYTPTDPYKTYWLPVYRLLADVADHTNSRWQQAAGQSGHPGSRHYDDLMKPWRDGVTQPFFTTKEGVKTAGKSNLLKLEP